MKNVLTRKTFVKLIAVCLCVAIFMALGTAAYAAAPTSSSTGSITVDGIGNGTATFYNIIDITVDASGNVLPPVWDSAVAAWVRTNYPSYIGAAADAEAGTDADDSVQDAYANLDDAAKTAFAEALAAAVKAGNVTPTSATSGSNLAMGGYLILVTGDVNIYQPMIQNIQPVFDTTNNVWDLDTSVTIGDLKYAEPSITKQVKLPADSAYSATDTVQCSTGDTVDYLLEATVPSYPSNATLKTFEIGDDYVNQTLVSGSIKVYGVSAGSDPAELATGYSVNSTSAQTSNGTAVDFLVTLTYDQVKAYDSIQVKYSTTLNKDAVVGPDGNDNTAYLDYSNNPYYNATTDSTPYEEKDDSTAVFTYGINITKVDKANESTTLKGATFTVSDGTNNVNFVKDASGDTYRVVAAGTSGAVTEVVTGDNGTFSLKGLEAGTYTLTETVPPAGYNLPSNATTQVVITADTDSATGAFNGSASGNATGIVAQTIINSKGAVLPQTGSAGEVILICVSVLLAASAAVFYVVDVKRKNSREVNE